MRIIIVIFLLFVVSQIYGRNFRPGFIITNEQDTINGWIDFRTDARNMAVCNFKACESCEVTTFLPGEIFGYRFYEEGKFYVSREIEIRGEPRTVFLEFLVQGMMNLFYYVDTSSEFGEVMYFFFEDQNGRMISVTRRPNEFIRDESGHLRVHEDWRYRGMIRYLFKEEETVSQQADRLRFDRQSMINIVRKFHDLTSPIDKEYIVFENPNKDFRNFQFSIYGGALIFPNIISAPMIGGRMNISVPRLNRNLSFQADLGVSRAARENDVVFILPLQAGLKYALGRESNMRPTVGFGFALPFAYAPRESSFVIFPMTGYASLGLEGNVLFFDVELHVFSFMMMLKAGIRF